MRLRQGPPSRSSYGGKISETHTTKITPRHLCCGAAHGISVELSTRTGGQRQAEPAAPSTTLIAVQHAKRPLRWRCGAISRQKSKHLLSGGPERQSRADPDHSSANARNGLGLMGAIVHATLSSRHLHPCATWSTAAHIGLPTGSGLSGIRDSSENSHQRKSLDAPLPHHCGNVTALPAAPNRACGHHRSEHTDVQ